MQRVKLLAPHTHGGEAKVKGDTITVNDAQKDWLEARGLAVIETTATPVFTAKPVKQPIKAEE